MKPTHGKLRAAKMTRWLVWKSVFVLNGHRPVNRFCPGFSPSSNPRRLCLRFPLIDTGLKIGVVLRCGELFLRVVLSPTETENH